MDKLPFRFTGKELDEETGLYYYGARYLDPKYSRWLSTDQALSEYIPQVGADTSKLPNGGVYNSFNFAVFGYGNNNPVKYNDPTGEIPVDTFWDLANIVVDLGRMGIAKWITKDDDAFDSARADLGLDLLATAIPYAPAGVSKALKVVTFTGQTVKGIHDSVKSYKKGDIVGGTLSVVSTVIVVGSAGLNRKLDIDIADATKRRELVPRSMRIDQTCKIIRAEKSKNIVTGGNLMLKGTGAIHEMTATSSDAEDNKTPSAPLLIYKKEILMEKGMILCE